MIYIGSILAIRYDKHMVVDILYEALPGWGKRILDKVVLVVVGVFLIVLTKEGVWTGIGGDDQRNPSHAGEKWAMSMPSSPWRGWRCSCTLVFPHKIGQDQQPFGIGV